VQLRAALEKPVAVVTGEVGAGKSLLLDRLLQRATVKLREDPSAPLPAYLEAWEVAGRLRDAVVEKTAALGDARTRGAVVFLDGVDEVGRSRASRLVREARILVGTLPNTTVLVAGRPLPGLAHDHEQVEVPELTPEETLALIEGLTGRELHVAETHRWPESIAEAVRRPLFATLMAVDMRSRDFSNPRSIGELLAGLVDRALEGSGEELELEQLRHLAVASTTASGGPVRAADVATTSETRRLLETGLIFERDGRIGFSLHILNEWFAAQALQTGLADTSEIVANPGSLERWRYPLAIAVGTFGYARVKEIIGPVAAAAPGFASQVVGQGLARSTIRQDAPPTPMVRRVIEARKNRRPRDGPPAHHTQDWPANEFERSEPNEEE